VSSAGEDETAVLPRRRGGRAWAGITQRWLVFVVFVLLWQSASASVNNPYFPTPASIVAKMHTLWFSGPADHLFLTADAVDNILPSLARLLAGWAIAAVLGVVFGIAIGRSPLLYDLTSPMISFARAVPAPLLFPVFLLLFKLGSQMQLATISFGVVWPILLNTIDGAASIDQLQVDTVRSFRISRLQWLVGLALPAAMPKILSGLRIALGLALVLMVISETVGATNGIGYELVLAQNGYDNPVLWAGIVLLGSIGNLLNRALLLVERRVLSRYGTAMDQQ
jgi:ABC-type nitrate/sulfonate/bicarbonate transport system permease component